MNNNKKEFPKCKFSSYLSTLSDEEKGRIRDQFCEISGKSQPSWYFKVRNERFFPLEQKLIEQITGYEFAW